MQVGVFAIFEFGMEIAVRGVLALPFGTDVAEPALDAVVGVEGLQVFNFLDAAGSSGLDEVVFSGLGAETAVGDVDGAGVTVVFFLTGAMVGFELGCLLASNFGVVSRWKIHTRFRWGHMSSAVQPSVFQLSKSLRCARVYIMKLMELPPPSVPPHGTIGSRSAS